MRISFVIAGLVVAGLVIVALTYGPQWFAEDPDPVTPVASAEESDVVPPTATAVPQPDAALPVEPAPPEVALPPLGESDAFVQETLAPWSLPGLLMDREDLLPRLAVVIQNAAEGRLPRRQLGFLLPSGGFITHQVDDKIYVDGASYARYDRHLDVLESVPVAAAVEFVSLVEPLLNEALRDIGDPRELDSLINEALERVENVPVIDAPIELVQPNVMYAYADETLEGLPELDKQLLRLGPENLQRLKAYVSEFRELYRG